LDKHKCIERSTDCDCPICNEYMFNSHKSVIVMQCGHSIHRLCFEEHMKTSYKCPLCNKSCINMEYQFRNFDIAILNQPMPAEYADARAVISCNDCSAKTQTVYHWLGLKCAVCRSYNTTQLQLLNMPGGGSEQQQHLSSQQQQQSLQPLLTQQQPVALDPALLAEQLQRQTRAARRVQEQQQRERDRDGEPERSFALLSSSPSSYSPAYLFRLLYRTALSDPQLAGPSAPPLAPPTTTTSSPLHVPGLAVTRRPDVCDSEHEEEEDGDEDNGEDDMLDLFGAWDRDFDRMTGLTSAESAVGFDDDDEEEEGDDEDESEDEREDGDEDDDEEEEEDILLLGHR
jgi:tyrosyl-DNA phosphodiesterase 2